MRRTSRSPLPIHHLTIYHRRNRTHRRCRNPRPHDRRWIHASILRAVRLCQAKTKKFDGYIFFNQ